MTEREKLVKKINALTAAVQAYGKNYMLGADLAMRAAIATFLRVRGEACETADDERAAILHQEATSIEQFKWLTDREQLLVDMEAAADAAFKSDLGYWDKHRLAMSAALTVAEAAIRADMKERCAKVCDVASNTVSVGHDYRMVEGYSNACKAMAAAIRALEN